MLVSLLLAMSCSDDGEQNNAGNDKEPAVTAIGLPVGDPVTKTIGSGGGSIASEDGVMELTIPAGALAANTDIIIQPVTNEAPGGIGLSYDLLPSGTVFSKPATLTFHYTDGDINGSNPLCLYIAYQDNSKIWISDLNSQILDSLAQTISLDINHFTIFSEGTDHPRITGTPLTLKAGQTSSLSIVETTLLEQSSTVTHSSTNPVPDALVRSWKVNSDVGGNGTDGTIEGTGARVTYRAPAIIDRRRTVDISAPLNITVITTYRGQRTELPGFEPHLQITLEPTVVQYDYEATITYVDSTVSPFYGGLLSGLPVYSDKATFDVNVVIQNDVMAVRVYNIENQTPTVVPGTKGFQGTDYIWIPDSTGVINIDKVISSSFGAVPEDSVLQFSIQHKNANYPGGITQSSEDGTIYGNAPPYPFTGTLGIPQVFDVDLKRRGPYYDPSHLQLGSNVNVFINPVE
jgi:hypothetical protein